MSTQSGPGSQSSDLLDDSELMTDDRELDADLVGKLILKKLYDKNCFASYESYLLFFTHIQTYNQ